MPFDVMDTQPSRRKAIYAELVKALLSLPPGKSLRVPRDTFHINVGGFLRMGRFGRKLHSRKMPDGWYLWLEEKPTTNGATNVDHV